MIARRWIVGITVVVALGAAGCIPVAPPPPPPTTLGISTSPALYPAFDPAISDYVVRCTGAPVSVEVAAPSGTYVSVDLQAIRTDRYSTTVGLSSSQSFPIVTDDGSGPNVHWVRCLPPGFPDFSATKLGTPQAQFYLAAPASQATPFTYPALYDTNGVPVWWAQAAATSFATLLDNGEVAWTTNPNLPAHAEQLDGTGGHDITTTPGAPDTHDLLVLPNGNYVMVSAFQNDHFDMSLYEDANGVAWGPTYDDVPILDHTIQEIQPDGQVVNSWTTSDHIPPTAMDPQWSANVKKTPADVHDVYHWNAIEPTATGFLLSFRHLDAIYSIQWPSGAIDWKLGGTPESGVTSLSVVNDPVFTTPSPLLNHLGFGGQHDIRLNSDGTVSLHDNGTNLGRAPRAVRYAIDETLDTATLVETKTDGIAPSSFCCGSARKLTGGNWVVAWGGTENMTELDASGARVFRLQWPGRILYRVEPVEPGVLDIAALRAAMDAQYH